MPKNEEVEEVLCHKVGFTKRDLKTKKMVEYKSVIFRESKISDNEKAIRLASARMGKKPSALLEQYIIHVELLKILIVQIDGKKVNRSQLEVLDTIFTNKEFKIIQKRLIEIEGDSEEGDDNPLGSTVEVVTTGAL